MNVIGTQIINKDLSSDKNKYYQKFNGSFYVYGSFKITVCRTKKLPDQPIITEVGYNMRNCPTVSQDLPTYPYVTMDYNWNTDDGMTILIEGNNKKVIFNYKRAGFTSAEDPRIYRKADGKIYMYFMSAVSCTVPNCSGIWEVEINFDRINELFTEMENENLFFRDITETVVWYNIISEPIQVCKFISTPQGDIDIFDTITGNVKIYKNFSPIEDTNSYLDGINGVIESYQTTSINNNQMTCSKTTLIPSFDLNSVIQKEWKHTLTTPTIKVADNDFLGVTHIRIKWENITDNYNTIEPRLRKIIQKSDVHHNDFYFMSVYYIKNGNWIFTKPFIITGDTSDNYFSYNICFPCGIKVNSFTSEQINVLLHHGIGDCLLAQSLLRIPFNSLSNKRFTYRDLKVYTFQDELVSKEKIYPILRCNYETLKYILPSNIFIFDLGGSGLKFIHYSFHIGYTQVVNLGRWSSTTRPDLSVMLAKINIDLNTYIRNGTYLLFSLAGIEKLWEPAYRKQGLIDYGNLKIRELFDFPDYVNVIDTGDANAHMYGSLSVLGGPLIGNSLSSFVLYIALGTSVNTRLLRNSSSGGILRNIEQLMYPWNYNFNGLDIKTALIQNVSDSDKFLEVISTILSLGYGFNDIQISKITNLNIIISGGGTINLHTNLNIPQRIGSIYTHKLSDIVTLYLNSDPLTPYKGLVEILKIQKGIIRDYI